MQAFSRQLQGVTVSAIARHARIPAAVARSPVLHAQKQAFSRVPFSAPSNKAPRGTGRSPFVTAALFGSTMTKGSIYDYQVKDADGKTIDLSQYKGKVVLIINVASACGFTPQYKEMAALYDKYKDQGLVILGFPCNQFGGQEPGTNAEIKKFAQARGAKYPIMAKIDVNGSSEDPLYTFLKSKQGGLLVKDIKWNFTKFLVSKDGDVVGRYGSATTPVQIEEDIKKLL